MQTSASSDIRPNTFCGDSCCRCRYWLCGYLVPSFWFCCISSNTEDGWTARPSRSTSTSFTLDIETNAFTGSSSTLSRSSWSYRWTCFCRRSRSLTKAWQQSSRCLCWSDLQMYLKPYKLKVNNEVENSSMIAIGFTLYGGSAVFQRPVASNIYWGVCVYPDNRNQLCVHNVLDLSDGEWPTTVTKSARKYRLCSKSCYFEMTAIQFWLQQTNLLPSKMKMLNKL